MMALPFFERFGFGKAAEFFKKENRFLGFDIGSSSVKLVGLRKEKERAILETYGELSLAKYADGDTARALRVVDAKLTQALKDLLRESQARGKSAAVSIPLKDSFVTTMHLPQLDETDLKEAVPFEARKYIPVPINEVILDWWVLPPNSKELAAASIGSRERRFINVLLAAVPREVIAKYKNIFSGAGLTISAFEIEVFSFARAALRNDFGTTLLMDLGASSTRMSVVDAGVVRVSHSFDKGSQELTLALSQSMGVDFERAELLKRESGILRRPETEGIHTILEPLMDLLATEGERFIIDWRRRGGEPISKILIGGGGALLKGMEDFMVRKYGVEVGVLSPFSKVVYPAFLEPALKGIGATFTNAIGLALRDF